MTDLWSFLLQTLTVCGATMLVLAAKAIFRDKLSPRWQFCAWGLVGLALLVPAGRFGRYALINWPVFVEAAKSLFTGEYGTLTKVIAPIPLPIKKIEGIFDWIYIIYVAGVFFFLARYIILYLRLRLALKKVREEEKWQNSRYNEEVDTQKYIDTVAEKYHLSSCPVLMVDGLSSAFICGVFHPVLVLPAGVRTDEKIVLHELLHQKYRDVFWGLVICVFRCLHWCNPLIWFYADLAGNDLESLCDQRVLERLCGEERRDYGRILLAMAGGNYAKMPGTSSIANGGKNIKRRIMAIAHFKKYPAGMGLVSICILLIFSVSFFAGTKPTVSFGKDRFFFGRGAVEMARARTICCSTYAGAFDTYAKAVLTRNLLYLAMCAPLDEQNQIAKTYREGRGMDTLKGLALPTQIDARSGYQIYNLARRGEIWEGLLVLKVSDFAGDGLDGEGSLSTSDVKFWFAVQHICVEKQGDRFVAIPKEEFCIVQGNESTLFSPNINYENSFPDRRYEASMENFLFRMQWQTLSKVESEEVKLEGGRWVSVFNSTPKPDGEFSTYHGNQLLAIYTGDPEEKSRYTQIGHTGYLVWDKEKARKITGNYYQNSAAKTSRGGSNSGSENEGFWSSSSSDGTSMSSTPLEEGWKDEILLSGGGGNGEFPGFYPECYVMDFYLNHQLQGTFVLRLVEEENNEQ